MGPKATETVIPGEGKRYRFVGKVKQLKIFQDYVELHLQHPPGHIWLGHLGDYPQLAIVHTLNEGDEVAIEFIQHGWGAAGVHRLLEIRKYPQ